MNAFLVQCLPPRCRRLTTIVSVNRQGFGDRMKKKRETFSDEITEVLTYYYAVAQRSKTPKVPKRAERKLCTNAPLRIVPIRAGASRTR
jgi:hypothetical protein